MARKSAAGADVPGTHWVSKRVLLQTGHSGKPRVVAAECLW